MALYFKKKDSIGTVRSKHYCQYAGSWIARMRSCEFTLKATGWRAEFIFPIDFGIYLSVITPLSINTQSTGFHTAQAYTQSNDGFV